MQGHRFRVRDRFSVDSQTYYNHLVESAPGLQTRLSRFSSPADGEAVADRGGAQLAPEAVNREHLVRVVVLEDVSDRPDGLLVLVQASGLVDVVQALGVRGVPVAAREVDRHLLPESIGSMESIESITRRGGGNHEEQRWANGRIGTHSSCRQPLSMGSTLP